MRLQKPDSTNNNFTKQHLRILPLLIGFGLILITVSCKSDIDKISALILNNEIPSQVGVDYSVSYTDSGRLQLSYSTPLFKYFSYTKDPYYEFPEGIRVVFYDENEHEKQLITAKYALYYDTKNFWEARDSVVARDLQTGRMVESEQMFWDQNEKKIYSEIYTKITDVDGMHDADNGFEAAEDLSRYRMFKASGNMRLKDEE